MFCNNSEKVTILDIDFSALSLNATNVQSRVKVGNLVLPFSPLLTAKRRLKTNTSQLFHRILNFCKTTGCTANITSAISSSTEQSKRLDVVQFGFHVKPFCVALLECVISVLVAKGGRFWFGFLHLLSVADSSYGPQTWPLR